MKWISTYGLVQWICTMKGSTTKKHLAQDKTPTAQCFHSKLKFYLSQKVPKMKASSTISQTLCLLEVYNTSIPEAPKLQEHHGAAEQARHELYFLFLIFKSVNFSTLIVSVVNVTMHFKPTMASVIVNTSSYSSLMYSSLYLVYHRHLLIWKMCCALTAHCHLKIIFVLFSVVRIKIMCKLLHFTVAKVDASSCRKFH